MHAFEGEELLREDDILDFINKEEASIALVLLAGVQYYTGQLLDIARITKAVHCQVSGIGGGGVAAAAKAAAAATTRRDGASAALCRTS